MIWLRILLAVLPPGLVVLWLIRSLSKHELFVFASPANRDRVVRCVLQNLEDVALVGGFRLTIRGQVELLRGVEWLPGGVVWTESPDRTQVIVTGSELRPNESWVFDVRVGSAGDSVTVAIAPSQGPDGQAPCPAEVLGDHVAHSDRPDRTSQQAVMPSRGVQWFATLAAVLLYLIPPIAGPSISAFSVFRDGFILLDLVIGAALGLLVYLSFSMSRRYRPPIVLGHLAWRPPH
jgi:hypothetical protein